MASKLAPATPRSRAQKASNFEVDRTSPSSKTGVSMFGESSPSPKAGGERRSLRPLSSEKRPAVSRGAELHQVQEDLVKAKEQLALMEKSKSNLLQDLARSKRQVEDLTAKLQESSDTSKRDRLRADEMEHASFTAAEDWQAELEVMKQQYEMGVLELQTNKQTIESLRHELVVCGEAKDEAVRLAGEAMNAAESTAKRVEELSAELLATKGSLTEVDSSSSKMTELMDELLAAQQCLAEAGAARDRMAAKGEALLASKDAELKKITETASVALAKADSLKQDLESVENMKVEMSDLNLLLADLRDEVQSAKNANGSATLALAESRADYDRVNAELEKAKESETVAFASLAALSAELTVANENLIKATVEGAALESSLEFLKDELQRRQLQIQDLQESEASAIASAAHLRCELDKLTETNHKEIVLLKEKESSDCAAVESLKSKLDNLQLEMAALQESEELANATAAGLRCELNRLAEASREEVKFLKEREMDACVAMGSLKQEIENLKLELGTMHEKERLAIENYTALSAELDCNSRELVKINEKYLSATERSNDLERELETCHSELAASRQIGSNLTTQTDALMSKLQTKELEVGELQERVASMDTQVVNLSLDSESKSMVLGKLYKRAQNMANKVTALSIVVSTLAQTNQSEHLAFAEKEAAANTRVTTLDAELVKVRQDLESVLSSWKMASEDVQKLNASLKNALSENEVAKREAQAARAEAAQSKEDASRALAEVQAAQHEGQEAEKEARTAKQQAQSSLLEAKMSKDNMLAAQEEAQVAKQEAEAARMELHVANLEAQTSFKELEHARLELDGLRKEWHLLQTQLETQAKQSNAATKEIQATMVEVANLQAELSRARADEEEVRSQWKNTESRLQDALHDLETRKNTVHADPVSTESMNERVMPELEAKKDQVENSFHVETVVNGSMNHVETPSLEIPCLQELDHLKVKLREMEERLSAALQEVDATKASKEKLCKELEATKVESETNKKAILEVHQHLADTEKAKSNMEAEIQRLLDDSKQWQTAKDAIDIPIHSETNGRAFSPDSREEKPQPDSIKQLLKSNSSLPKDEEDQMDEGTLIEREELVHKEDEVVLKEDAASFPAKKKKKPLLLRLGTYLEKKKP